MRQSTGRQRRTRTLSVAAAVACAACAGGVRLGLADGGARAAATTVTVTTTAELRAAVAGAVAGTVIELRGGTYRPAATLAATADGTRTDRITLTARAGETVLIDGSRLPDGAVLADLRGDYWTLRNLTFQRSPARGVVVTSSTGGVFENLVTADNGGSGLTLQGDGTTGNLVENLDSHGNYDAADHGRNADGLALTFGSGTGNRVTGARLSGNADDGLDLWQFSSPVTVEHSRADGNGENRWRDPAFAGDGDGFALSGGGALAAHTVRANEARDNAGDGFTAGAARLTGNRAAGNRGVPCVLGPSAVSTGNSWDREE
ncbi:hypothetical protein GCM10010129_28640 [Streptomyces fumigatiscleroticus]|nr:hypothetical protein GCM10010129_28640 [Streptomyces fumigatiscleroticus]